MIDKGQLSTNIGNKGTPIVDLNGSAKLLMKRLSNGKRELEGRLSAYYTEKAFGFITAYDGNTYHLHVSNVTDAVLSGDLNALMRMPGQTRLQYYVLFEDGGKTHPDAAYRTAKNVRLMLKE